MAFNKVALNGRISNDLNVGVTKAGGTAITFNIAVDNPVAKGAEKTTSFFTCNAFNSTADFIKNNFQKGKAILVSGRLNQRSYVAADGSKRSVVEIIVSDADFPIGDVAPAKEESVAASSNVAPEELQAGIPEETLPF